MRTIVTGGAGFIGSHLAELLLQQGHSVGVLDNFSTGRPENLAHLSTHSRLTVHRIDVSSDPLDTYFEGVDWVFHLASLADIVPSIQRPLQYHRANVDGTVAVVEAARKAGALRVRTPRASRWLSGSSIRPLRLVMAFLTGFRLRSPPSYALNIRMRLPRRWASRSHCTGGRSTNCRSCR